MVADYPLFYSSILGQCSLKSPALLNTIEWSILRNNFSLYSRTNPACNHTKIVAGKIKTYLLTRKMHHCGEQHQQHPFSNLHCWNETSYWSDVSVTNRMGKCDERRGLMCLLQASQLSQSSRSDKTIVVSIYLFVFQLHIGQNLTIQGYNQT